MGQVLGGRHQVYVICPLVLETEECLAQLLCCHLPAEMSAADLVILAEAAAQGTAGEEYSAASAGGRCSADAGLLPVVEGGSGSRKDVAAAAKACGEAAVGFAHPGAEAAVSVRVKGKDIRCIHVS